LRKSDLPNNPFTKLAILLNEIISAQVEIPLRSIVRYVAEKVDVSLWQ
jgi:hypothetical protein